MGDVEGQRRPPNPILEANRLSKLLFFWIWPLFSKGFRSDLKLHDLYEAPEEEQASHIANTLEKNWNNHKHEAENGKRSISPEEEPLHYSNGNMNNIENGNVAIELRDLDDGPYKKTVVAYNDNGCLPLLKALLSTFGCQYFSIWPVLVFTDCFRRVIQPWFLLLLIRSFLEEKIDRENQYFYAAGLCFTTLGLVLTCNPCLFYIGRLGIRTRIGLSSLIQRKMMRLSQGGLGTDPGKLVNLFSNDSNQLEQTILFIPYLVIAPVQWAIFMYFLWEEFGICSIAGVGFILFFIPFQYWNGSMSAEFRKKIGAMTYERSSKLNETITGMNTIKMYAWENIFKTIIDKIRKLEVQELRKRSSLHAFYMSIFLTCSRVVPSLTFMAFVLVGGPLTADRVFYAIAVYNTVTHYLGFFLPAAIRGTGEIVGSLTRIQTFLLLDEKIEMPGYSHTLESKEKSHPVVLESVSARWSDVFKLNNISITIPHNKFVMVVGPVGSGKSSLLRLLLADLLLRDGTCTINGKMSYASQIPWLYSGTIRENILFHSSYDEDRYKTAIRMAGLVADLADFKNGDNKQVGDRGTALSGGQKARVNLARALYRQADIYLLDDPLSQVDSAVGRSIFSAFKEGLEGKVRILVTHQHQYLKDADHLIVVENGTITAQGSYEHVMSQNIGFFANSAQEENADVDSLEKANDVVPKIEINQSTEEEDEEKQTIGLKTYWEYFKAGDTYPQFCFYLMLFLVSQVFAIVIESWLALWTNAEERELKKFAAINPSSAFNFSDDVVINGENNLTDVDLLLEASGTDLASYFENLDQSMYLYVYAALTGAVFLTNLAKAIGFFRYCMRVSNRVHKKMLASLVRAQPKFFDTNSSGRILNRFTRDIGVLDSALPFAFFDMFTIFLQIATVIFLIILANWYTVFPIIIFLVALWFVRRYYVATSRDLKRIDEITRSPICPSLTSCYEGLVTIRAWEAEGKLINLFDDLQDCHTSAAFLFLASNKCFDLWIEFIATVLLTIVTFSFLLAQNYLEMSFLGGNVGLAICSAMSLTYWLQYGMRTSADVENFMISVERALEYTKKLTAEADLESSNGNEPPKNWPTKGGIKFENIYLSYKDNENVLKNLSFEILPGEKFGIVGRTAAGKSSILRALIRMTEPKGQMSIDGILINKMGLHDVRQNISIIPQDPVIFYETLRFNLDPSGQATDDKMQSVLKKVNLKQGLDFQIDNGGTNLSVGERQLVSLARALLRDTNIIAMDECSAHIDLKTDAQIQKTLCEELKGRTLLTIAHRLQTVIESEKILVMEDGCKAEFDIPHNLLQNPNGALTKMVNATGQGASELRKRAAVAYEKSLQKQ